MVHGYALSWSTLVSIGTLVGMVLGLWRVSLRLARWMDRTDSHLKAQDKRLEDIEHELKPNSGHSHHDQVVSALEEMRALMNEWRAEAQRPRRRDAGRGPWNR